jgi:hypothetical protein
MEDWKVETDSRSAGRTPAAGWRRHAGHAWALVAALALLAAACDRPLALSGSKASADEVARTLLEDLASADADGLRALALDEQEFRRVIWPRLPAARPERNLPFSYVWGDLRQKSGQSLARVLARYGGRRYELLGVRFDGATDYGTFRVHRRAVFRVRDAGGAALDLRPAGSMVEQDGEWKVFSYVAED